jgi:hypothetical protein
LYSEGLKFKSDFSARTVLGFALRVAANAMHSLSNSVLAVRPKWHLFFCRCMELFYIVHKHTTNGVEVGLGHPSCQRSDLQAVTVLAGASCLGAATFSAEFTLTEVAGWQHLRRRPPCHSVHVRYHFRFCLRNHSYPYPRSGWRSPHR